MRIAFALESNTDRRLIEGLAARCELTVIAREGDVTEFAPAAEYRLELGPASRPRYAAWLLRRLRRGGHDAVLAQGYFLAAAAANLAARTGGPPTVMFVCNPMERYYRCREHDPSATFRRSELAALGAVARFNARAGKRYAVLSRHLGDVVAGHGAPRERISVIPAYGVDLDVFSPGDRDRARAALHLPPEPEIVFFSSRVSPEKDAPTLVKAFGRVAADRDVRLLSCARRHEEFLALAREHGVGDKVIARDMVDPGAELAEHYRACDLVVQASREEGLGFAPLEALACGVPVVAAAVGGLRETILAGRTGWPYPPGDADALAQAIGEALADPAEGARRAQAGRELVAAGYETGAALDALVALLRDVSAGA